MVMFFTYNNFSVSSEKLLYHEPIYFIMETNPALNPALNGVYPPNPFVFLSTLINILLYPLTLPFIAMSQLPSTTAMRGNYQQMQIPQIPQTQIPQRDTPNVNDSDAKTTYANTEEWELQRDEKGRLGAIVIHRKATRSD